MKYCKKRIPVEAFQMTRKARINNEDWPTWLNKAWNTSHDKPGSLYPKDFPDSDGTDELIIHTLEGNYLVSFDDWIIQGIQGEIYPCKPDIFAASYEECK